MKICFKCGAEEPLSEYCKSYISKCSACVRVSALLRCCPEQEHQGVFSKGKEKDKKLKGLEEVIVGSKFLSNSGCTMIVVEFNRSDDVVVMFPEGNKVKTTARSIRQGEVRNVMFKSVYGKGYLGVGIYKARDGHKITKSYKAWAGMLERCYVAKVKDKYPTYKDCTVSEEWHNYQNFAKWYYSNPNIESDWHLDKDIIIKGNKHYSKETCAMVPSCVNSVVLDCAARRGEFPLGVYKQGGKFCAHHRYDNKLHKIGCYNTPEEAHEAYKEVRGNYLKSFAERYVSVVDQRVLDSLSNWFDD